MRICILGDIHLFTLDVRRRALLSKRVFAHTNLMLNRRHRFNHGLLPELVDEVISLKPDLVLFSGDVSTSSLEREFEALVEVVKPLSDVVECVLVPGNHDRYTFNSRRVRRIETLLHEVLPERFPHHRRLSDTWSLLALDSAIPQRFFSRGALGDDQYDEAVELIRAVPEDQGLMVLCHYPCSLPPRVPSAWSHDLRENHGLRRELQACRGRVVFVHGHIHKPWHVLPVPVAPSASENDTSVEPVPAEATPNKPTDARRGRRYSRNGDTLLRPAFECINAGSPCFTSDKFPLGQGFWRVNLPADAHAPLDAAHIVPEVIPPDDAPAHDSAATARTKATTAPAPTSAGLDVRWIARPSL